MDRHIVVEDKEEITMKKVYISVNIFHHKESLDLIEQGCIGNPFYIRIKPTNCCNHHCAYCTYGSGNTDQRTEIRNDINYTDIIPREKMMEIIEDMGNMSVKAITFSGGGEPLTYSYIDEAVKKIKEKNIELSLITNGQLLKGKIATDFYDARWVRISFDSPNAEEYARIRGISVKAFERVIENIENFAKYKDKNCVFGINFVISKANYNRIYEAAKLMKELGVDNIKFAAVVDNKKQYHISIKDEAIEQIHKAKRELESQEFHIINNYENDWMDKNFFVQPFSTCYTCRLVTVIAADQKVYLCHTRAYDSNAVLADLREKSFREAWCEEDTKRRLLELKPGQECKNFCAYQERNELIEEYFNVDYRHINFI